MLWEAVAIEGCCEYCARVVGGIMVRCRELYAPEASRQP